MKYDIMGRFWNANEGTSERVRLNSTTNKDYAIFAVNVLQKAESESSLHAYGTYAEYWYEVRPDGCE